MARCIDDAGRRGLDGKGAGCRQCRDRLSGNTYVVAYNTSDVTTFPSRMIRSSMLSLPLVDPCFCRTEQHSARGTTYRPALRERRARPIPLQWPAATHSQADALIGPALTDTRCGGRRPAAAGAAPSGDQRRPIQCGCDRHLSHPQLVDDQ
jgi:hypothetical protein